MEKATTSETIGCDLGDKESEICVLNADGKVAQRASIRTNRKGMMAYFTRAPAHVVIEVGGHSRWVSAMLRQLGHRVTIANPRRVKLISESQNKTDRHDAELLARLGRADAELLAPVKHRAPQTQADLAVAKARDVLVAVRTKLVNHVRGTVKSFGERMPKCAAESFARKTRSSIPTELRAALEPVYEAMERIDEQIREQDKMIERVAKRYPGRGGRLTGQRRGSADGIGLRADDRRQGPIRQEPDGGSLPRAATSQEQVGRRRSTAADHEDGGSVRAAAAGDVGQLHPRAIRQGQRVATVGAGTGEARRQERQEAGKGRGGEEAGGADAPAVGHRRGVRAAGVSPATDRGNPSRSLTIQTSSRLPCTGGTRPAHPAHPRHPAGSTRAGPWGRRRPRTFGPPIKTYFDGTTTGGRKT
jgi:transposase